MTTAPSILAGEATRKPRSRQRFERKREAILDAATDLINECGAKGTTLLNVARAVDLNTTSVTYYFRRKEQLAAAVFERTMKRLEGMVQLAGREPTPEQRVRRFLAMHFDLRAAVLRAHARPMATLSDVRTLDDPLRVPLEKQFQGIFRGVRNFFGAPRSGAHKDLLGARAHILLEVVFWLPIWLDQYALDDFPRVFERLFAILAGGVAAPGAVWRPLPLPPGSDDDEALSGEVESGPENFLRVATLLINETGYRGASVERIVEELKVTKGSFYHHLDAKDDLVLECFRRSYKRFARIQRLAHSVGRDEWQRLATMMDSLLQIQFEASWPLMRTTAWQALPPAVRAKVVARSNRTALRLAGVLIDGAVEGSLRVVDPMIASQVLLSTLNSAFDMRKWASRMPRARAIALFSSPLIDGLFNDRMLVTEPDDR
jgi:AcrR family transcriptional regulator